MGPTSLARAPAPSGTEVDVMSITTVHAHRKPRPGARRATIPGAAPDPSRCPSALPLPDCPGEATPRILAIRSHRPGVGPRSGVESSCAPRLGRSEIAEAARRIVDRCTHQPTGSFNGRDLEAPVCRPAFWPCSTAGRPNLDDSCHFGIARFGRIGDASASRVARVGMSDDARKTAPRPSLKKLFKLPSQG